MFGWLQRFFKKNNSHSLTLSDDQIQCLQRLSGFLLTRRDELTQQFPDMEQELSRFYKSVGPAWEWFPAKTDTESLSAEIRRNPGHFEVFGAQTIQDGDEWEYHLFEMGIRQKSGKQVICRAKLLAHKKTEQTTEEYLLELSKI